MAHIPTSVAGLVADQAVNTAETVGTIQTVISGVVTAPSGASDSFFEVPLSTPFEYNGVDNLFVEFSRGAACTAHVPIRQAQGLDYDAGSFASLPRQILYYTRFGYEGGDNAVALSGTSVNEGSPFHTGATNTRVQLLYTAEEIDGSGPITGVALQSRADVPTGQEFTVTIKMGHSSLSNLTADLSGNYGDTPVILADNAVFRIPAGVHANAWVWLPLTDGTFNYNGTDNLLLEIDVTDNSSATGSFTVNTFSGYGRSATAYADSGAAMANSVANKFKNVMFRFNGGTIHANNGIPTWSPSGQVLGGLPDGGQVMSLYPASYLGAGGKINSIDVRLSNDSAAGTIPDYKIYMGHSAKTALTVTDTYQSNMDDMLLVYDGSFEIPAGLKAGDWLTIPLQTPFNYGVGRNLALMFAGSHAGVSNTVSLSITSPNYSVGRDDNAADMTGTPRWGARGFVTIKLDIER